VVEGHRRFALRWAERTKLSGNVAVEHDFGGKASRWCPSTSFAGPPPRSGEDRLRPLPTPKQPSQAVGFTPLS